MAIGTVLPTARVRTCEYRVHTYLYLVWTVSIHVCTVTYWYIPGHTGMSRYIPECLGIYLYIPVYTGIYLYVPVHTSTYQYIPVCTGTYPEKQKYCMCITTGLEPATSSIPNGSSHRSAATLLPGARCRYWIC